MAQEGLSPDPTSLASILKACARTRDIERGQCAHACILHEGWLETDIVLGSALLDMFVKCGKLAKALQVFEELSARDLISWNSLIAGYSQQGYDEIALAWLQQSLMEGLAPSLVTFTCSLKSCGNMGALEVGKRLHAVIVGKALVIDVVLGSALVDMYAKCGAFSLAKRVLDELPSPNEVSWTGLISGFCQNMHCEDALACYEKMEQDGFVPDCVTFSCVLKACGKTGAVLKGIMVHAEIQRLDLLGKDTVLGNALVSMYGKCGSLRKAQEIFDQLPVHDLVSWNALMTGYCQHGHGKEAIICFEKLEKTGLIPDAVTYLCVLNACSSVGAIIEGKKVHAEVMRRGLLGNEVALGNALVDMYAKCDALEMAHEVFDGLFVRDVVSWNALITGCCEREFAEQALQLFDFMKAEGHHPNALTFACILKACASVDAVEQGEGVHNEIVKKGLFEHMDVLGNALVALYGKCGIHAKAWQLFQQLSLRDVVSWNALITGCCKHRHGKEALELYELMQNNGVSPDEITFACILKVCSTIGATEKGREFFSETIIKGFQGICIKNKSMTMYAECAQPASAQYAFHECLNPDTVTWNALTSGYCEHGFHDKALIFAQHLQSECICPDAAHVAFPWLMYDMMGKIEEQKYLAIDD
ncbi:hypothetical protein KP509_20G007900 [Ceratopteris richardii]|nr:hypothetical protein KP509_20G007900 [Ceratopteris richardii]